VRRLSLVLVGEDIEVEEFTVEVAKGNCKKPWEYDRECISIEILRSVTSTISSSSGKCLRGMIDDRLDETYNAFIAIANIAVTLKN